MQVVNVVGEQTSLGVAQHRSNPLSLTCYLCLLTEGLQLAANFASQVVQSGEVSLHCVKLANRLFFTATVFQNSGGFLDESATLFWGCLEHTVELTLTYDDVHFTPEPGVGK